MNPVSRRWFSRQKFGWALEVYRLGKETLTRYDDDNGGLAAAAVAFYGLLSLGPLVLLITYLAGIFIGQQQAELAFGRQLAALIGETGAEAVERLSFDLERGRYQGLGLFSALVAAYGGTRLFINTQTALNQIWNLRVRPAESVRGFALRLIQRRALSMAVIAVLGALLLATVFLSTGLSLFVRHLPDVMNISFAWRLLELGVSFLLTTFVFGVMYALVPDAKLRFRFVWAGAALAASFFVAGKLILGWYIANYGVMSIDGTAAALIVVLLWAIYSSNVFLVGAEFTQVYAEKRGAQIRPQEYAFRVSCTEISGSTPSS